MVTPAAMVHMLRVTSAQCPTTQIGTTSPPRATATPLQVLLVIVQETIQEMHTIMELATPSILAHAEDSITTIVGATRLMFQNETYGNVNEDLIKII